MSDAQVRNRIAEQQAGIVRALAMQGDAPSGFDAGRVHTAAESLLFKRRRTVARVWPALVTALGQERFRASFLQFAKTHALPRSAMPVDDGVAFARWLARDGDSIPDAVRVELLRVELTRGFAWPVRLVRLQEVRCWIIAIRVPIVKWTFRFSI